MSESAIKDLSQLYGDLSSSESRQTRINSASADMVAVDDPSGTGALVKNSIDIPFNQTYKEAFTKTVAECMETNPTGVLSFKNLEKQGIF